MRVVDVRVIDTEAGAELRAAVTPQGANGERREIVFAYRGVQAQALSTPGDALLAAVLLPAMAAGEDVTIDAPVSPRLLENAEKIVDIWSSWRPAWRRSSVSAAPAERADLSPSVVAACFSGGVDSLFTALRPRDEPISLLLTDVGFTFFDELRPHLGDAVPSLERAARGLGKDHLVVESNTLAFGLNYLDGEHHGAVLAAMALGLGSLLRRCYIAASWPIGLLRPWGSHPEVDPLWSTETLDVVHDGAELTRVEKVKAIASSEVALETLRVCTRRRRSPENCRTCAKCQATGLMLHVAGALEHSRTLGPVTPETIRRTLIGEGIENYFTDLLGVVNDPEFEDAIGFALRRSRRRRLLRPLGRLLKRSGLRE